MLRHHVQSANLFTQVVNQEPVQLVVEEAIVPDRDADEVVEQITAVAVDAEGKDDADDDEDEDDGVVVLKKRRISAIGSAADEFMSPCAKSPGLKRRRVGTPSVPGPALSARKPRAQQRKTVRHCSLHSFVFLRAHAVLSRFCCSLAALLSQSLLPTLTLLCLPTSVMPTLPSHELCT